MATPLGTNVVTSIARRYIVPEIVDNIYRSNPVFFRMYASNRKLVRGGTHIEVPLMYRRFTNGGFYSGYDVLDTAPNDTVKNGAWDWRQAYVPVTVDGLTLIKVDSPEAIADFIRLYFAQAEMEMCEVLADGLWSTGGGNKIDGLSLAVDSSGTYAGIDPTADPWWKSVEDATTATLSLTALQSVFGSCSEGGRHPTLIVSSQAQYNRYWALNTAQQRFPVEPSGARDEQLAQAGFSNLLFNGTPWVVDSHVPADAATGRDPIFFLNEDYIYLAVSPRADFYLEPFQTAINQDAMVAKLLWAGNLCVTNRARQGKMTNVNA
jgi:hypothetical protein